MCARAEKCVLLPAQQRHAAARKTRVSLNRIGRLAQQVPTATNNGTQHNSWGWGKNTGAGIYISLARDITTIASTIE